jgi:hypothetical protein
MRPAPRLFALGTVAGAAGAALAVGHARWNRTTARALHRLAAAPPRTPAAPSAGVAAELFEDLPAPVRRYFQFALAPGQGTIVRARVRQDGVMRSGHRDQWQAFTARQTFSTNPAGFVWAAELRAVPLVPIRIRDEYIAGGGASEASLGGLIRLAGARGTPEVTSASLLRYLAEAALIPTALLPDAGVRWTSIDARHALATLTDEGTTVSMRAEFGERGEIIGIVATRERAIEGRFVPTPWFVHFHGYSRFDGMMIPTSAEVEWRPPGAAVSVWRGHVLGAEYDFAE